MKRLSIQIGQSLDGGPARRKAIRDVILWGREHGVPMLCSRYRMGEDEGCELIGSRHIIESGISCTNIVIIREEDYTFLCLGTMHVRKFEHA